MTSLTTEPIHDDWTEVHTDAGREAWTATAADLVQRLALIDVHDIDDTLAPLLAAAAAEVAVETGIPWSHSPDDPPVAMLRLIALVARRNPTAGGPHTMRLLRGFA